MAGLVGWRTFLRIYQRQAVRSTQDAALRATHEKIDEAFLKQGVFGMAANLDNASSAIVIRDAAERDFVAIQRIYAHYVLHALATFEETPPDTAELRNRHAAITHAGLPYLVAESAGEVVGYSYATAYRPRSGYRHTIEDSIYIDESWCGRGVGAKLLEALIQRCEAGPWRELVAVIGSSQNAGSIALHSRFGFEQVGVLRNVGFKLGCWVDSVLMQRSLGDDKPPMPAQT